MGPPEFHRSPGELSERSLSGVSQCLGPEAPAGQETPAGAFVFPSTTGLRKLLARSGSKAPSAHEAGLSDGGSARARVPCVPRHRPCKEGPGGGWGAALDIPGSCPLLSPRAGKCRVPFPQNTQGELVSVRVPPSASQTPSSLSCVLHRLLPAPHGGREAACGEMLGWPSYQARLAPNPSFVLVQCCSEYSVLGRKAWPPSLTSRGSDVIGRGRLPGISNLKNPTQLFIWKKIKMTGSCNDTVNSHILLLDSPVVKLLQLLLSLSTHTNL